MCDLNKKAEKFEELANDIKPIALELCEVLKKHGIKSLQSLSVDASGYIVYSSLDDNFQMKRFAEGHDFKINVEYPMEEEE